MTRVASGLDRRGAAASRRRAARRSPRRPRPGRPRPRSRGRCAGGSPGWRRRGARTGRASVKASIDVRSHVASTARGARRRTPRAAGPGAGAAPGAPSAGAPRRRPDGSRRAAQPLTALTRAHAESWRYEPSGFASTARVPAPRRSGVARGRGRDRARSCAAPRGAGVDSTIPTIVRELRDPQRERPRDDRRGRRPAVARTPQHEQQDARVLAPRAHERLPHEPRRDGAAGRGAASDWATRRRDDRSPGRAPARGARGGRPGPRSPARPRSRSRPRAR